MILGMLGLFSDIRDIRNIRIFRDIRSIRNIRVIRDLGNIALLSIRLSESDYQTVRVRLLK